MNAQTDSAAINGLIKRARSAMAVFRNDEQSTLDETVGVVAAITPSTNPSATVSAMRSEPAKIGAGADLDDAARKIGVSKVFDNATSCSSENAVVILEEVFDVAIAALERAVGYLTTGAERERIISRLWVESRLDRLLIAKDASVLADVFELSEKAHRALFFMAEESGIHTRDMNRARELVAETDVVRVLVNQAHTFGNGGGFDNGLPFTLSMGCGTWGGNSIAENLNYRHFINITHLVTTIPEDKPSEQALFGAYWKKYGK